MSMVELPPSGEFDPQQRAVTLSPVLRRFFGDSSNIMLWQKDVYEVAVPLIEKLDNKLGENIAGAFTEFLLESAKTEGVYSPDLQGIQNIPYLVTAELLFVGWELNNEQDLAEEMTPVISRKVETLPFTLRDSSEKIQNYVRSCLKAGSVLKKTYDQKTEADSKKKQPMSITYDKQVIDRPEIVTPMPVYAAEALQGMDTWIQFNNDEEQLQA